MSKKELTKVYLKKTVKWAHGGAVAPVDLPVSSAVRNAFSKDVLRKSAPAMQAFWRKRVFQGVGVPPIVMASDAKVLAYIKRTPGAVGYVANATNTSRASGVKVIGVK